MISEQLDLFGGPPKPPKKIREEAPALVPTSQLPAEETEAPALESIAEAEIEAPTSTSTPLVSSEDEPMEDEVDEWPETDAWPPVEEIHEAHTSTPHPAPVSEVIAWMAPHDLPKETTLNDEESAAADEDNTGDYPNHLELIPITDETIVMANKADNTTPTLGTTESEKWAPDAMNVPPDELLFKRQYYSMRETAAMFDISHSMLRYWENEFDILQPRKNKKGDRYFRPADVKNLQLIYHLLKVRRFTIEGAREYLRSHHKALDGFELIKKLEKIKLFLHELKAHL